MEKAKRKKDKKILEGIARFNRVSPLSNALIVILFAVLGLIAIAPAVFTMIISLSDSTSIQTKGYSFLPDKWSLSAYGEIWKQKNSVGRAFLVSIGLSVVGCVVGLFFDTTMAYPLSRRNFKFRQFYTVLIFIPMLFSGGMVASYLVNTAVLGLKNTFWALLLPIAASSWYIIILRTFFQTTVPEEIIESGKVDGASQLRIFVQLVLPISLPALATIGLFLTFQYWNDWFLAKLYIESSYDKMYPLQFLLIQIQDNMDFLLKNQNSISNVDGNIAQKSTESIRMAICMVIVLPIACSYPFFQKYFISGLTIGAVKG